MHIISSTCEKNILVVGIDLFSLPISNSIASSGIRKSVDRSELKSDVEVVNTPD